MLRNDQNNKKVAHRDRIKTFLSLVLSRDHNRKLNLNTSQTLIFVINTTVHIWTSLLSALGQVSHLTLSLVTGNDSKKSFTGTKAWGGKLHCWEWETPQRKHTHTHRQIIAQRCISATGSNVVSWLFLAVLRQSHASTRVTVQWGI